MQFPVVRCGACGKSIPVNEATFLGGLAFCSDKCKEDSLKKEV
ncbi:DUF2116 family Zn-ribbon domain-containing protein [Candidatus Woesearchaeota archaeon]|nr:DUF2116 family Zn-ribbon domain-containing protein [Candidatus Woesearchaeota archaeon]MCF7901467.1 DUF2116 family Zn-ribbon domain-containing protein [Candidatus Woesearchaeota archaeon]MCF8013200.1 DUF2116 family Zn-ribbon domain-containing protein [Candidatus Woesearchaeota archaeon]